MRLEKYLVSPKARLFAMTVALLASAFSLKAQAIPEAQVPSAAVAAFTKSAPGLSAKWQAGPQSTFEAIFLREGKSQVYVYDQAGLLQVKKIKAAMTELPVSAQKTLAAYPNSNVEAAYKVVSRTQEKYYEVQMANAGSRERLRFDLEGKPTGKVSISSAPMASAATPSPAPKPAPAAVAPAPKPAPVAVAPAPKPAPVAVAPAPKPAPAAVAPAPKPAPVAVAPAPKPAPVAAKPAPAAIAMRGESATTKAPVAKDDLDDESLDDLMEEDEDWEDLDSDLDDIGTDDLLEEDEDEWEILDDDDDDLN